MKNNYIRPEIGKAETYKGDVEWTLEWKIEKGELELDWQRFVHSPFQRNLARYYIYTRVPVPCLYLKRYRIILYNVSAYLYIYSASLSRTARNVWQ